MNTTNTTNNGPVAPFVITMTYPVFCPVTDGVRGSATIELDNLGSFESLAWAEKKAELLGRLDAPESEVMYRVVDANGRYTWPTDEKVPAPVASELLDSEEIPF
jgi:hypothetical protein